MKSASVPMLILGLLLGCSKSTSPDSNKPGSRDAQASAALGSTGGMGAAGAGGTGAMGGSGATGGTGTPSGTGGTGAPVGGTAGTGTGAGGTGGASTDAGSMCKTDADCRLFDDYCTGCDCRALAKSDPDPTCMGPGVRCLRQPCGDHVAVCDKGRCAVRRR